MIIAHLSNKASEFYQITHKNKDLLADAVWIDVISPTRDEEIMVEEMTKTSIPTREEMAEIELSSRLYKDKSILYMTASMIAHAESPNPIFDSVSFVLTKTKLITVRYIEPTAFKLFSLQIQKLYLNTHNSDDVLMDLLDATIDRLADILELVGRRVDEHSKRIFRAIDDGNKPDYLTLMQQIGVNGDLTTKTRESLMSFSRLLQFFSQHASSRLDNEDLSRLKALTNDVIALSDHADFLSNKIIFLLEATLGMIGIEQNNIIKIFSVAAVIFLPPTLIASIYGMNFHYMPELSWKYGYEFAIVLMLFAAFVPYKFFKRKKWL